MAPIAVTLKYVPFAVGNLCKSHTLGNVARIVYDEFTRESNSTWPVISTVFLIQDHRQSCTL